jgi:hypothetical protein
MCAAFWVLNVSSSSQRFKYRERTLVANKVDMHQVSRCSSLSYVLQFNTAMACFLLQKEATRHLQERVASVGVPAQAQLLALPPGPHDVPDVIPGRCPLLLTMPVQYEHMARAAVMEQIQLCGCLQVDSAGIRGSSVSRLSKWALWLFSNGLDLKAEDKKLGWARKQCSPR